MSMGAVAAVGAAAVAAEVAVGDAVGEAVGSVSPQKKELELKAWSARSGAVNSGGSGEAGVAAAASVIVWDWVKVIV